AVFTVFLLVTGFHILSHDRVFTFETWFQPTSFDFAHYQNPLLLIPLSVILSVALWTISDSFKFLQKPNINSRPTYALVFFPLLRMEVNCFSSLCQYQ